jgi:hypothetical protein
MSRKSDASNVVKTPNPGSAEARPQPLVETAAEEGRALLLVGTIAGNRQSLGQITIHIAEPSRHAAGHGQASRASLAVLLAVGILAAALREVAHGALSERASSRANAVSVLTKNRALGPPLGNRVRPQGFFLIRQ